MKILTQNLMVIVSLFLALALISCVLMFTTESHELRWGLEEEVSSLAVATASYIRSDKFDAIRRENAMHAGKLPSNEPAHAQIFRSLRRLLGYGQAKRIYAITPNGKELVFNVGVWENGKESKSGAPRPEPKGKPESLISATASSPQYFQDLSADLREQAYVVTPVRQLAAKEAVITAFAPVLDASQKIVGIVGVDVDASGYVAQLKDTELRAFYMCVFGTLIGVIIACLVSSLITREVQHLNNAALEIARGNLNLQIQAGKIQEVSDLGSTFNTMSDVLKDVLTKTRRSLIEGEQFRSQKDLVITYGDVFWEPLKLQIDGVEVVAQHVGDLTGSFFGVFRARGGTFATVGSLFADESLREMASVSSAYSLWQQRLEYEAPEVAFRELATLFEIEKLECIFWRAGESEAQHWKFESKSGELVPDRFHFVPGKPFFLHTLGEKEAEIMQRYGGLFGHLPPDELFKDILVALPTEATGSLLIASHIASA